MGWSPQFWFRTTPEGENWSPHVALYGDMGNENAQSLARLQEETQRGLYDAILHVGDFAYDMNDVNESQCCIFSLNFNETFHNRKTVELGMSL